MRIVVDVMGGDHAPRAPVEGAVLYAEETDGRDEIILIGDQAIIETQLKQLAATPKNIRIEHTTQVVDMDDQPTVAVKQKKDSSMVKGIRMQKEQLADAFVSAGSTGAQMAATLLTLGRVKGVQRPAMGAIIPHEQGVTFLIDVGANADCKPSHLYQFGLMGAIYMEQIFGVKNPQIGLLNIGEEKSKGNELMVDAYQMMADNVPNFAGNIEGRYILDGKADVVVTDGFTGNVVLKFAEGLVSVFSETLRGQLQKRLRYKIGALLARPAFAALRQRFDYEEYGGVPLLGVDGISIICHGSSSAKALKNAIHVAHNVATMKINDRIEEKLSQTQV